MGQQLRWRKEEDGLGWVGTWEVELLAEEGVRAVNGTDVAEAHLKGAGVGGGTLSDYRIAKKGQTLLGP